MPTIDVEVDDILWSMSKWDKKNIANSLYDNDGIVPKQLQKDLETVISREPSTPLEQELWNTLELIWDNRMFLNDYNLKTLKHLSKKGI